MIVGLSHKVANVGSSLTCIQQSNGLLPKFELLVSVFVTVPSDTIDDAPTEQYVKISGADAGDSLKKISTPFGNAPTPSSKLP